MNDLTATTTQTPALQNLADNLHQLAILLAEHPVPTVEVVEDVEQVEWRCQPLLADEAGA